MSTRASGRNRVPSAKAAAAAQAMPRKAGSKSTTKATPNKAADKESALKATPAYVQVFALSLLYVNFVSIVPRGDVVAPYVASLSHVYTL